MKKLLVIWNVILSLAVVVFAIRTFPSHGPVTNEHTSQVVRTQRLELTDSHGKLMALLRTNDKLDSNPELVLYTQQGREAAFLTVNQRGYATLFMQSNRTMAKVAIGYLQGGDTPAPLDRDDPSGGWGMNVRGERGTIYSFGTEANGQPLKGESAAR